MSHGRTPHGVRGLKLLVLIDYVTGVGRTPHGVRGLKFDWEPSAPWNTRSHPSRGAWIEIIRRASDPHYDTSHPSRGAWIEIYVNISEAFTDPSSRTPHGVRGLKLEGLVERHRTQRSHPSRGAWIEMSRAEPPTECTPSRTPHGVRGLKSLP